MQRVEGTEGGNSLMRGFCQQVSSLHGQQPNSREQKTSEYNYLVRINTFPWSQRGFYKCSLAAGVLSLPTVLITDKRSRDFCFVNQVQKLTPPSYKMSLNKTSRPVNHDVWITDRSKLLSLSNIMSHASVSEQMFSIKTATDLLKKLLKAMNPKSVADSLPQMQQKRDCRVFGHRLFWHDLK